MNEDTLHDNYNRKIKELCEKGKKKQLMSGPEFVGKFIILLFLIFGFLYAGYHFIF